MSDFDFNQEWIKKDLNKIFETANVTGCLNIQMRREPNGHKNSEDDMKEAADMAELLRSRLNMYTKIKKVIFISNSLTQFIFIIKYLNKLGFKREFVLHTALDYLPAQFRPDDHFSVKSAFNEKSKKTVVKKIRKSFGNQSEKDNVEIVFEKTKEDLGYLLHNIIFAISAGRKHRTLVKLTSQGFLPLKVETHYVLK